MINERAPTGMPQSNSIIADLLKEVAFHLDAPRDIDVKCLVTIIRA
jgi:hypothetical protein